jgi:D-alanine-D-alanine ligase
MKKNIAFVTGGYSSEAQVSYKSALFIEQNFDTEKYSVYKIDINKEKGWHHIDAKGLLVAVDKNDFSLTLGHNKITFDCVFIGIHGTPGEDGKLQGYLDMLGIPYTTCDAASSALTFNKRFTTAIAGAAGVSVAKSKLYFKHSKIDLNTIEKQFKFPVFVKPNNGGSSLGLSKVHQIADLQVAMDRAFIEDSQVMIEEMIAGSEFTTGVYRNESGIHTLPITSIVPENDFFDYEAKYLGKSKEVTPAVIDESIAESIRACIKLTYEVCNCSGVVRIDTIYNHDEKKCYLIEVNTVPGQTAASILPQQLNAAGIKAKDFYTSLIEAKLKP